MMTSKSLRIMPVAVALLLAACDNAGSGLSPDLPGVGGISVQVFLDRDGSVTFNPADTLYVGARIALRPVNGGNIARTLVTENNGFASVNDLLVGDYSITVEPASIGDSIVVAAIDNPEVHVQANTIVSDVRIRLSYPTMSVRQARQQAAGKRVMIKGLVLAGIQSFRDSTSNVRDTSVAMRLTRVSLRNGGAGNFPGDSVTVLGTVSTRAGQPVLDQAVISVFANRPAPVALAITSAVAATAQGGALDASLVIASNMVISVSAAQAPDYRVVASDGSGPLTIIFDGTTPINPASVPVGRTITVRGVLVPDGAGKWQLKPRDGNDVTIFVTAPLHAAAAQP